MGIFAVTIFVLVLLYTFYMGFNDGSNAIATTVATRAVKPKTAITIAAITKFLIPLVVFLISRLFNTSGFVLAANISGKTVYPTYFADISSDKAFAFLLAGMIGATIWGGIAYALKIPNSTSHTLLGALIGSGIAAFGFNSIQWNEYVTVNIILMVVLAPISTMIVAYFLTKLTKRLLRKMSREVNNILTIMQRINIIALSATFSLNNSQKAIGIVMMLSMLGLSTYASNDLPIWIILLIGLALGAGVMLGGYRVINTVGRKIFKLQPMHSVIAQLSTSALMLFASNIGISVSTGQVMSSAIIGVGSAERFRHVKWGIASKIAISWILTLPLALGFGAAIYLFIAKVLLKI
ncbi:MAG: inorganic phosphate transporter [Christensenellaceae bacterium]|jgi:PiT family inorganic phosphate transporter|nr:inorganic phosphate transporter [Christensenellaceae bacterium]